MQVHNCINNKLDAINLSGQALSVQLKLEWANGQKNRPLNLKYFGLYTFLSSDKWSLTCTVPTNRIFHCIETFHICAHSDSTSNSNCLYLCALHTDDWWSNTGCVCRVLQYLHCLQHYKCIHGCASLHFSVWPTYGTQAIFSFICLDFNTWASRTQAEIFPKGERHVRCAIWAANQCHSIVSSSFFSIHKPWMHWDSVKLMHIYTIPWHSLCIMLPPSDSLPLKT